MFFPIFIRTSTTYIFVPYDLDWHKNIVHLGVRGTDWTLIQTYTDQLLDRKCNVSIFSALLDQRRLRSFSPSSWRRGQTSRELHPISAKTHVDTSQDDNSTVDADIYPLPSLARRNLTELVVTSVIE